MIIFIWFLDGVRDGWKGERERGREGEEEEEEEDRVLGRWLVDGSRDTRKRGGEPLATLIKIPAVEFYLRRARYWS